MSKILVTGGAGFIGTNLIIKLLESNHKIVSIDNYSIGKIDNHQDGVEYIDGDVCDIDKLVKNDFDYCFHLAGLSRIQPSFDYPKETFLSNTESVLKVLDWAKNSKTKIIYSGSSSKHHNPLISPYATFKFLGEEICKLYRNAFKSNVEIVRFYNVYGPYEIIDGEWAALIGKWRGQVKNGNQLTIVGDGKQRRDFTHVHDIVDGLIKIAYSKNSSDDAWELGTGINYSILDVFELFKNRFNSKAEFVLNQDGNYKETLRETNDAIEILKWSPKDRLKEYIENLQND